MPSLHDDDHQRERGELPERPPDLLKLPRELRPVPSLQGPLARPKPQRRDPAQHPAPAREDPLLQRNHGLLGQSVLPPDGDPLGVVLRDFSALPLVFQRGLQLVGPHPRARPTRHDEGVCDLRS